MTQIKGTASPEMAEEEDEEEEDDEEEVKREVDGKEEQRCGRKVVNKGGRIVENAWALKKWWRKLIMNKLTTKKGGEG